MNARELHYHSWLRLLRTPGVGNATINKLLASFGSIVSALDASAAAINEAAGRIIADKIPPTDDLIIQADLDWLHQSGNGLLTADIPRFPSLLQASCDSPVALFYTGDIDLIQHPQLAIVGSRTPTRGGIENAHDFAADMAARGLGIVSGLAAGIDAAAHRGALDVSGITIAVVGTGLDRVYPAANHALAVEIATHGLLLSEYPPGTPPHPRQFPRRNRIIAGLALGTLVVEAAEKSGSLITARLSSESGREVFAIPGSIHNPLAKGTHRLIRQGAKLVESAADILEELAPMLNTIEPSKKIDDKSNANDNSLDDDYQQLLKVIAHDPISADELIQKTGLTAGEVSSMLLILELNGHIECLPGNRYSRTASSPIEGYTSLPSKSP